MIISFNNQIYYDYIQKSSNEFFYYTNKNKFGKLYKSFNYSDFEKNNEDSLSNQEIKSLIIQYKGIFIAVILLTIGKP